MPKNIDRSQETVDKCPKPCHKCQKNAGDKKKGTPRTRQSSLTLAAFLPWGSSRDGRHMGSVKKAYYSYVQKVTPLVLTTPFSEELPHQSAHCHPGFVTGFVTTHCSLAFPPRIPYTLEIPLPAHITRKPPAITGGFHSAEDVGFEPTRDVTPARVPGV